MLVKTPFSQPSEALDGSDLRSASKFSSVGGRGGGQALDKTRLSVAGGGDPRRIILEAGQGEGDT